MSLTSQINDPESPYRVFVAKFLPALNEGWTLTGVTSSEIRINPPSSKLGAWKPGSPIIMPERSQGYPWATVGTALDYRLRFRFVVPPASALIAYLGAQKISEFLSDKKCRAEAFVEKLVQQIHSLGVGPNVPPQNIDCEIALARLCYGLSLFDPAFRASNALRADWPAVQLVTKGDFESILQASSAEVADDCANLASLAFQRFPFNSLPCKGVVNPVFAGSLSVGGADADLVINGLLVDLKTTSKSGTAGADVMQAIGYLMLDWDDSTHINELGLYYARHGVLASWSADHLVDIASRGTYGVSTLRSVFKREFSKYAPQTSSTSFTVHWGFDLAE